MDTGFITLHRKITENSVWRKPLLAHLTVHLILMANHEEKKTVFAGKDVVIGRGQLVIGRFTLAENTGIKSGTIPRLLKVLEKSGFCNIKTNNRFSLITIIKYSDYQTKKVKANTETNNKRTTDEQQTNTNNNVNNENNENQNTGASPPDEVNLLLDFFKQNVNPHIKFDNKTERQACKDLINTYGFNKIKQALIYLGEKRKTDKYLPVITTPWELWTKWAKIKQHLTTNTRKIWKPTSLSSPSLPEASTE